MLFVKMCPPFFLPHSGGLDIPAPTKEARFGLFFLACERVKIFMAWNVFGATTPAPYHTHQENQDYYGHIAVDGACLLVAADGAGSCPMSRVGAEYAVTRAITIFTSSTPTARDAEALITQVRKDFLETFGEDHKDYSCTLTLVMLNGARWCSATIGDAFSMVLDEQGEWVCCSGGEVGEYANETVFLNSKHATPMVCEGESPVFAAVSTDGLQGVSFQGGDPFPGFWGPVSQFTTAEDVTEMFHSMCGKGRVVDDTTLLCATRGGAGQGAVED